MEVDIVGDTLRRMGLFSVREVYAGDISQGDRKRLEMGMMVASNIDVLLLDEPTAGLSQYEVGTVLENIVALKGGGKTLILVEHDMDVVFRCADIVSVMDQGRLAFEGTPVEVAESSKVRQFYLGSEGPKG
jgi:branched-chain amino acid transport system ATP-binding protein